MHPRCQRRALRDLLGLGDQEHHRLERLHQQSHLGVEHQNQFRPQDEVHLDEVRRSLPDVVRLDVVRLCLHLRLRQQDEVHLDEGGPCLGLKRMGYCRGEPSGVEFPCPGLKRMGCCLGEEFQQVELELGRQVQLLLPAHWAPLEVQSQS
jgi:hypothetical protein